MVGIYEIGRKVRGSHCGWKLGKVAPRIEKGGWIFARVAECCIQFACYGHETQFHRNIHFFLNRSAKKRDLNLSVGLDAYAILRMSLK
jgi:hypothetical protein